MKIKFIIYIIFCTTLFACAKKNENEEVKELYEKGLKAVYQSKYETAKNYFNKIDSDFPYTEYANNTAILLAYIYYRQKDYSMILPIVDVYIKTNPRDKNMPYLLYLKSLTFYDQIKSYKKDKEILLELKDVIQQLKQFYPESEYSTDIENKYKYTINTLFLGELYVAIQYHKQNNCVAALPRYINLLTIGNHQLQEAENKKYQEIIHHNISNCFYLLKIEDKEKYFSSIDRQN